MTYPIAIEFETRLALWLVRVAVTLHPLIGAHRAYRLAMWLHCRAARWRVNGGAWRSGVRGFSACSLLRPGHPPTVQPYPAGGRIP